MGKRRERLLRDPPKSFAEAMDAMHQGLDRVAAAGLSIGEHVVQFISPAEASVLAVYLGDLLGEPSIDNADLRGLVQRHQSNWGVPTSTVREFLEELRAAAMKRYQHA